MIIRACLRFTGICFSLAPFVFYPAAAVAQQSVLPVLTLISPDPSAVVIAKNPVISFSSSERLADEEWIVLFDGNDISALITYSQGVYSFFPPEALSAGEHSLQIIAQDKAGRTVDKGFVFRSRQSEPFAEIYSSNTLSTTAKSVISRDISSSDGTGATGGNDLPYGSVDAYLSNESVVREADYHATMRSNIRYFDQNAAVLEPEKKGISVLDFLFSADYTKEQLVTHIEIGDTTLNESKNTIDYLTRRGGQISLAAKGFTVHGFGVLGAESGYEIDGLGFGFDSSDHIMGTSVETSLFDKSVSIKAIYARGGVEEDSFGTWSETPARKGEVTGLLLTGNFFDELLNSELEVDYSNYISDTDEKVDEDDIAYRFRVNGRSEIFDYDVGYSYTGPLYEVVGNNSIIKDWAGFDFSGGITLTEHALRLLYNYSWDNVEDEDLFARIYSMTSGLEYIYSGWQRFPASISLEYNTQRSSDEPEWADITSVDTYQLTANVGFNQNPWAVNVTSTYSEQNDKSEYNADTELYTFSLVPSYTHQLFSIIPSWTYNRSKDLLSDVVTDTNTVTLDLYSNFFSDLLSSELGGTYDWSKADDDSVDTRNFDAYAKLTYRIAKIWGLQDTSLALEYHFRDEEDTVYDSNYREETVTLVFSSALPYTF